MTDLLFYQSPVPLHPHTHRSLRLAVRNDYRFAAKTNSVPLTGLEFIEAAKEYAIVFVRTRADLIVPAVLLGLRDGQNVFVKSNGGWDAHYVPAFVRRYPFALGAGGRGQERVVCIDLAYNGLNAPEGEILLDEHGQPTTVLKGILRFLEEYQVRWQRTERFVRRLRDLDLFMALAARIDLVDGQRFKLDQLLIVDEQKLLAQPDTAALSIFRTGELAWIYTHLASLTNLSRLLDRLAMRREDQATSKADLASFDRP